MGVPGLLGSFTVKKVMALPQLVAQLGPGVPTLAVDVSQLFEGAVARLASTVLTTGGVIEVSASVLNRLVDLSRAGFRVVAVFDGTSPPTKIASCDRAVRRQQAAEELRQALVGQEKLTDVERTALLAKARKTLHRDDAMIRQLKADIDGMGPGSLVSYVQAQDEADVVLAAMVAKKAAQAVFSTDSDLLCLGCDFIITKVVNGYATVVLCRQCLGQACDPSLRSFGCLRSVTDRLLFGAILGDDYSPGIKGVGPKILDERLSSRAGRVDEDFLQDLGMCYGLSDDGLAAIRLSVSSRGWQRVSPAGSPDEFLLDTTALGPRPPWVSAPPPAPSFRSTCVEQLVSCLPHSVGALLKAAIAPAAASPTAAAAAPPSEPPRTRPVTYGLPGTIGATTIEEPVSFALAPAAFLKRWLYKHNITFQSIASHEELLELVLATVSHPETVSIRDPTGGDEERAARASLVGDDRPFWIDVRSPPLHTQPFSSAYLSSSSIDAASLRNLLIPLLLSFFQPKTAEMKAKYDLPHFDKIYSTFSHVMFAAAEQMRPDGGAQRILRLVITWVLLGAVDFCCRFAATALVDGHVPTPDGWQVGVVTEGAPCFYIGTEVFASYREKRFKTQVWLRPSGLLAYSACKCEGGEHGCHHALTVLARLEYAARMPGPQNLAASGIKHLLCLDEPTDVRTSLSSSIAKSPRSYRRCCQQDARAFV
jgi:hypothetical protein